MKLDSEQQRDMLIGCVRSAKLVGTFDELQAMLPQLSGVLQTLAKAELEPPSIVNTEQTKE